MESGAISDGQISASSQFDDSSHAANKGRLRLKAGAGSTGSWVVASADNNVNQWLQVKLGSQHTFEVTGVATQGRNGVNDQWVTEYKLQYSNDGINFQYYKEQGQSVDKVCTLYLCRRSRETKLNCRRLAVQQLDCPPTQPSHLTLELRRCERPTSLYYL